MEYLIMFVGAILLVIGVVFGFSSMYVIIPFTIAISVAIWYFFKKSDGESDLNIIWQTSVIGIIFAFIFVGLGSCIGSCTKGGGNTTQQRIEMGIPLY